jgi:hypothetical protein
MTEHARIAPLPNLPLFHKLGGRKAVVVGTSDGAAWKAELLEAAGADVLRLNHWSAEDLQGAAVAVADLHALEQPLRDLHRPAGRVAELAAGFLRECGRGKRRRRTLEPGFGLDRRHRPRQMLL